VTEIDYRSLGSDQYTGHGSCGRAGYPRYTGISRRTVKHLQGQARALIKSQLGALKTCSLANISSNSIVYTGPVPCSPAFLTPKRVASLLWNAMVLSHRHEFTDR